jgi:predicted glycosyltransferase involved in capsule biosynthesis
MKRFEHIVQTLPINIQDNEKYSDIIEFVVVDFIIDGDRRLQNFIQNNFKKELESGYLKYFSTTKMKYFHMSTCKNTAHRLSTGEILVNLDADNYTGKHGGKVVLDIFKNNKRDIFLHQMYQPISGNFGRISYYRESFFGIGGYDESFLPTGMQDIDLMRRLHKLRIKKIKFGSEIFSHTIKNSPKEKIRNTNNILGSKAMRNRNRKKSRENISNGKLIANQDKEFIGIYPL